MKKTFIAFAAVAASFLFASCAKMDDGISEKKGYTVTLVEESFKTTLTEGAEYATFDWEEADCGFIKIFKYTDPAVIIEASSVNAVLNNGKMVVTATFDEAPVAGTKIYGLYGKTLYQGKIPKVAAAQDCSAGKYDTASDILVIDPIELTGGTSEVKFKFRRPVGIGKMTLKGIPSGTTVSTVKLTTDNHIVERRMQFHKAEDHVEEWYWTGGSASSSRLLTLTVNGTVAADGTLPVWMVIDPSLGSGNKHFTIEVETSNGVYAKDISSKDVHFEEGKITRFGVVVEKAKEPEPEKTITVAWTVNGGSSLLWPFSSPEKSALGTGSTSASFAGVSTNFVLSEGGYTFIFYTQGGINRYTSGGQLRWNKTSEGKCAGDYIKFPVISGYTVTKVEVSAPTRSTKVEIHKFGETETVIGAEKTLDAISWDITEDNTGVQCGMVVTNDTTIWIYGMSITYTLKSDGFGTAGAPGRNADNVDYNIKL